MERLLSLVAPHALALQPLEPLALDSLALALFEREPLALGRLFAPPTEDKYVLVPHGKPAQILVVDRQGGAIHTTPSSNLDALVGPAGARRACAGAYEGYGPKDRRARAAFRMVRPRP